MSMRNKEPLAAPTLLHHTLKRVCEVISLRGVGLLMLLGLLLAGCSASTTSSTTGENGRFRPARSLDGLVDLGSGRTMYLECRGSGSPTVVLVSGLDAADAGPGTPRHSRPVLRGAPGGSYRSALRCDLPCSPPERPFAGMEHVF